MADDSGVVSRLLELALSAGAGAVVTLVAFRTRFALLENAIAQRTKAETDAAVLRAKELAEIEARLDARLDAFDRRQMMTLQILADVAKKVGVDQRFSDTLVRFLSEEAGAKTPRGD